MYPRDDLVGVRSFIKILDSKKWAVKKISLLLIEPQMGEQRLREKSFQSSKSNLNLLKSSLGIQADTM